MKPIIIIKERNKDGKFELTEQELKELIEKAYEQGVADGRPKATLPQSQYDRPEEGIFYRNINGVKDPLHLFHIPIVNSNQEYENAQMDTVGEMMTNV